VCEREEEIEGKRGRENCSERVEGGL